MAIPNNDKATMAMQLHPLIKKKDGKHYETKNIKTSKKHNNIYLQEKAIYKSPLHINKMLSRWNLIKKKKKR